MHFTSKSTIHLFIQFFNKYLLISYTVEVTNRFKGLDLIDRVPKELWTEVCDTVQEAGIMTIPKKKKCERKKKATLDSYKFI